MMKRNLRLLAALFKIRMTQRVADPASFWAGFIVDTTVFAVQAAVFMAIYGNVESIGGWDASRSLFFVGAFTLIDALEMGSFFFGLLKLPDAVLSGRLDLYVAKPASPLLHLAFDSVNPGSFLLAVPAIVLMAAGARGMGTAFEPARTAAFLAAVLLMCVLLFSLMVLTRIPSFWLSRAAAFTAAENSLMEFAFRVPGSAWKGGARIAFRVVLPYGLLAAFPSEVFFGEAGARGWLAATGTTAAFAALAALGWRRGLRRYAGAGG